MKNNNILIACLVAIICVMGVAFAAFSTSLTISGTGSIESSWGPIYIESCSCSVTTSKDTSNQPTASCTPASSGTTSTVSGTITTTMVLPGDKISCTFNVKNGGSLIAGAPTFTLDPATDTNFTVSAHSGTCLKAKSGTTLGSGTFKVDVEYKAETSSSKTIKVYANYSQGTSCS